MERGEERASSETAAAVPGGEQRWPGGPHEAQEEEEGPQLEQGGPTADQGPPQCQSRVEALPISLPWLRR